jgi:pimeloyl-ACP methyl ester carboxylesterase
MEGAMPDSSGPTVVLVHGAFADAGSWAGVTERLLAADVPVQAIVNPLRGVTHDAAYVGSFIKQIDGPVLAVGHSYGGSAITNGVPLTDNVVGLVYVAAFAPEEGELLGDIPAASKESLLGPALVQWKYPTNDGGEPAVELTIDIDQFHDVFTHDLSAEKTALYGNSQRPVAAAAFAEKSGHPAWKDLPSWAAIGTADKAIGADQVTMMAERANATITNIDASHVVMISQPDAVTEVILAARKSVG